MKLFGRNKGRPYRDEYEVEAENVLAAVGHPDFVTMREGLERIGEIGRTLASAEPLGEYDAFPPFDSIFQEVAWQDDYSDIIIELCKINSRVVFA